MTDKTLDLLNYKETKQAILFQPPQGKVMVQHPRTGEEITKAEFDKLVKDSRG